jgi:hypothetical protein
LAATAAQHRNQPDMLRQALIGNMGLMLGKQGVPQWR